ncbi:MAG: acetate--CoA ligase family protein, partial [Patescibacteria group bacterium]|nr:acetate--CoA ligase family protein [Patescibacteria group bacterium]
VLDAAPPGYLPEDQALAVLQAYGLPVPPYRLCRTADEAVAFAEEIGYPVVLRVVSRQVVHKSEVKGVTLNLSKADSVLGAFERMQRQLHELMPEAELDGMLVRRMIPEGYEVILGAKRDAVFGPTLMFGLGGIYVSLFKDVTFGLAPISSAAAARMVRKVTAFRLLEGARGGSAADVPGIEQCLIRLGQLVADFERITELDVNPLIALAADKGNVVADVRIRLGQ